MPEMKLLIARCMIGAAIVVMPVACSDDDPDDATTTTADDPTVDLTAPDGISDEEAETFADDFRLAVGRTGVEGFSSIDAALVQFTLDEAARVCAAVAGGASAAEEVEQAATAFEAEFVAELEGEPDALVGGWSAATFQTAATTLCPEVGGDLIGAVSGSSGD